MLQNTFFCSMAERFLFILAVLAYTFKQCWSCLFHFVSVSEICIFELQSSDFSHIYKLNNIIIIIDKLCFAMIKSCNKPSIWTFKNYRISHKSWLNIIAIFKLIFTV